MSRSTSAPIPESEAAFAGLYTEHVAAVRRFVAGRMRGPAAGAAEDVVSEVFARAWQAMPRFQQVGVGARAWLVTIAARLVIDYHRAGARREHVAAEVPERADPAPGPEQRALRAEARAAAVEALRAGIAALPAVQQQVLWHRFVAEASVQETADALGRTRSAVKAAQHRGLRALAASLPHTYSPNPNPLPSRVRLTTSRGRTQPHPAGWWAAVRDGEDQRVADARAVRADDDPPASGVRRQRRRPRRHGAHGPRGRAHPACDPLPTTRAYRDDQTG